MERGIFLPRSERFEVLRKLPLLIRSIAGDSFNLDVPRETSRLSRSLLALAILAAIGLLEACTLAPLVTEVPARSPGAVSLLAVGDIAYCNRAAPPETPANRTAALAQVMLTENPGRGC